MSGSMTKRRRGRDGRQTVVAVLVALGLPFMPVACLCGQASAAARVGTAEAMDHCHGAPEDRAPRRTSDHPPDCAHCHSAIGPVTAAPVATAPAACQSTVPPSASAHVFAAGAASHACVSRRTGSPPGHALLRSKCVLQV
jgi:hypothetical protein